MAIRRPHRSIEVFDISLMNVVTKAMGAFLVLMMLMYPHYQRLHAAQKRVDDAETQSALLAEEASTLRRQNQEMQDSLAEEQRLEQRRQQLEQQQRRNPGQGDQPLEKTATVLLSFSAADCDGSDADFYAEGEGLKLDDGSDWPLVQRAPQAVPHGVVEYSDSPGAALDTSNLTTNRLTDLWLDLSGPLSERVRADLHIRAQKQKLWAIDNVNPNSKFDVFAKARTIGASPCSLRIGAVAIGQAAAGNPITSMANLQFDHLSAAGVFDLGSLIWTGTTLDKVEPTPTDQAKLDQRLGLK